MYERRTDTHVAITSGRLALYLHACLEASGEIIASGEIGKASGVNATQVRRDLAAVLGRSGKRGTGYRVDKLRVVLFAELRQHPVITERLALAAGARARKLEAVAALILGEERRS